LVRLETLVLEVVQEVQVLLEALVPEVVQEIKEVLEDLVVVGKVGLVEVVDREDLLV
jgi:hypothetical protein